jgi:hypothetical protein
MKIAPLLVTALLFTGSVATPAAANPTRPLIEVLSSRADQVTGGDALIRVTTRDRVRVTLNGTDVTDVFRPDGTPPVPVPVPHRTGRAR